MVSIRLSVGVAQQQVGGVLHEGGGLRFNPSFSRSSSAADHYTTHAVVVIVGFNPSFSRSSSAARPSSVFLALASTSFNPSFSRSSSAAQLLINGLAFLARFQSVFQSE